MWNDGGEADETLAMVVRTGRHTAVGSMLHANGHKTQPPASYASFQVSLQYSMDCATCMRSACCKNLLHSGAVVLRHLKENAVHAFDSHMMGQTLHLLAQDALSHQ